MSKQNLREIWSVVWWVYVRTKSWGEVISLNANDFDAYGRLRDWAMPTVPQSSFPEKHLLQNHDILLVTKWTKFFAVLYKSDYWPAIASTAFMIIRINNSDILPEYLSIYMNEALQSAYFKNRTRWTSLPSIPRKAIEEYKVPIPTLQNQEKIIETYHEYIHQTKLLNKIKHKKKKLLSSLILSIS